MRLWTIAEVLRAARRGLTVSQLVERTGSSRASIYRDLAVLRESGMPIDTLQVNGETRHVLNGVSSGSNAVTPLQLIALTVARRALSSLNGTRLVRELDALTRSFGA